jgi:hypothetical protein
MLLLIAAACVDARSCLPGIARSTGEREFALRQHRREFLMPKLNEARRLASSRREPAAAIPMFRKLGISALVAACAWERKPLQEQRERAAMQAGQERGTAEGRRQSMR